MKQYVFISLASNSMYVVPFVLVFISKDTGKLVLSITKRSFQFSEFLHNLQKVLSYQ